ncbi:PAS domain S-box protein [Nodosilinea nodulosa]|uniref:PAS domain S-box protein n=1 Tax=Nodosilinea nodulosa TaxID=416001 RepID=UPI00030797A3|nr:PAS domain S-box protein [Nodosilinea nodulosa]
MLLMTGAVGVVGYLSFRNGQRAVNQVANELQNEILHQIKDKLDDYVQVAHNINRLNAIALARGDINPDSAAGETTFWQQNQIFSTASFVYCGNEKGNLVGVGKMTNKVHLQTWLVNDSTNHIPYFYGLDEQGNRNGEFDKDAKPFDARLRPWYKAAKEARQPTWSPIYLGFTTHWPAIATSIPVYNPSGGTLIGACGIDFLLPQEMSQFLKSLNIGKTGSAFIIERSGTLVSTSTAEPIVESKGEKSERLLASQSSNSTIRATADFLTQRFNGFDQIQAAQRLAFDIDGARQFVQVVPFQDRYGLDWLIVIVLPEADYLGQIQANIRDTLLLCLLALAAALILSVLTARWITRPVLSLNQSAKAIADGQWHQTVNIKRSDELGELANSFNQMAQQLQTAFFELQSLNQTLAQNETRLKAFLESLPIGISILDAAGHPYYANRRRLQLMGETIDPTASADQLAELYHLYQAGTDQLYPNEQLPIVQALSGKRARVDDIEIRQNGQTIPIEVWGTPIFDEQGNVAYAIAAFQDITERKQAENLLTHYNRTLEQQVAERMAALRESEAALRDVYDELRLREQELRLITDAVPVCIFYTDTDERYQFVNQACEDWFGLSRDQFIGKHNHEILGEAAYQTIQP